MKLEEYIQPDPDNEGELKSSVPINIPGGGAAGVLVGSGMLWYTNTAPAGYLICDGSAVAKADYPDLWTLLGDTWGTSTTNDFYLPDLRQRVAVGKHSSGTFSTLNSAGGSETHTLSQSELPNYVIGLPTANNGGSNSLFARGNASFQVGNIGFNTGGGGAAHNNLQPYRVVNYIIKT